MFRSTSSITNTHHLHPVQKPLCACVLFFSFFPFLYPFTVSCITDTEKIQRIIFRYKEKKNPSEEKNHMMTFLLLLLLSVSTIKIVGTMFISLSFERNKANQKKKKDILKSAGTKGDSLFD